MVKELMVDEGQGEYSLVTDEKTTAAIIEYLDALRFSGELFEEESREDILEMARKKAQQWLDAGVRSTQSATEWQANIISENVEDVFAAAVRKMLSGEETQIVIACRGEKGKSLRQIQEPILYVGLHDEEITAMMRKMNLAGVYQRMYAEMRSKNPNAAVQFLNDTPPAAQVGQKKLDEDVCMIIIDTKQIGITDDGSFVDVQGKKISASMAIETILLKMLPRNGLSYESPIAAIVKKVKSENPPLRRR